ncbi:MAG: D-alanine--D-alanine ligase [Pseudomonadota bacterium]
MTYEKNANIGVLLGGLSKEREVSLRTGKAMANALRTSGYTNVIEIDAGYDTAERLREHKIEVAVIALHGRYGEDGTIQGLLEFMKIPYTGSGVLGSAVAINKVVSKQLFEKNHVLTPAWTVSDKSTNLDSLRKEIADKVGFPCVAKPCNEGSTIGLTIVRKATEVREALQVALEFDPVVLWEEFKEGTELTVGFISGKALPIVEIVPKNGFYDYEAKYTKGMTDYYSPARVSDDIAKKVQKESEKAFAAVYAESFARVDLIWSSSKPWVLEVNTVPGMTETSLVPKAAKAAGISFESMVETILQEARLKV